MIISKEKVQEVKEESDNIFPVLMQRDGCGSVYLFSTSKFGILVLKGNTDCYTAKQYLLSSISTVDCFNPNIWKKYTGVICMSNQE